MAYKFLESEPVGTPAVLRTIIETQAQEVRFNLATLESQKAQAAKLIQDLQAKIDAVKLELNIKE